jgi:hypothetical protein
MENVLFTFLAAFALGFHDLPIPLSDLLHWKSKF